MVLYDFKVTVEGTDYENARFSSITVKGRENNVSSAILIADNKHSGFYPDNVDIFDSIQVYVKRRSGSYTELFDGTVRQCHPTLANQNMVTLKCKGLGQALLETHCNRAYGGQSDNPTLETVEEILEDLVDNMINKSYGSANNTNYAISKTYIPTIDAGLSIVYLNRPYQNNKEVIDHVLTVDTAYRNGATAGPHYFVDVAGNLRVKTISDQQAGAGAIPTWGEYCGGTSTAVTLTEGVDFKDYTLSKLSDEYANNIVLATDLRKPPRDFWTEHEVPAAWGDDNLDDLAADVGTKVVGDNSMRITFAIGQGEAYYPSTEDAGWDVTTWGSEKTIPHLNFYFRDHGPVSLTTIYLFTDDHNGAASYTLSPLFGFAGFDADKWYHISLPIGPYWVSAEESKEYRWTPSDGADWTDINGISFSGIRTTADDYTWIDDLHFSGKIVREAVDTTEVTDNNEHQKVFISRTALDDSCKASDDTGMAGYYTYAELLRRVNIPRTLTCTIPIRPEILPGEYFKVYAGKTAAGTYKINGVDFRTLQYVHNIQINTGYTTTLSLSDDLLNSFPINPVDTQAILNEYLLINNAKATDMKGGEVDLLIPHMRKTY